MVLVEELDRSENGEGQLTPLGNPSVEKDDAQQQADFFWGTLCIEKLSKDELRILLNIKIQEFVSKCHPLLLALLSPDEGGATGEI